MVWACSKFQNKVYFLIYIELLLNLKNQAIKHYIEYDSIFL